MSHAATIAEAITYHAQAQQNHEGEMQLLFAIAAIALIAIGVACNKAGFNKGKSEAIRELENSVIRGKVMKDLKDGQAEPKPEFANPVPTGEHLNPVPPAAVQKGTEVDSSVVGAQLVTPSAPMSHQNYTAPSHEPSQPRATQKGDDLDDLLWNALEEEHERQHGY